MQQFPLADFDLGCFVLDIFCAFWLPTDFHSRLTGQASLLPVVSGSRTEVRVHLQVPLHGVDEVPAGQEDEHGSGHLQRLDVSEQRLHQLERRLLLVDLSHGALGLHRVLGAADHVTVGLQGGNESKTSLKHLATLTVSTAVKTNIMSESEVVTW